MEFLRVDSTNCVHDSMRVQLLQLCDAHCHHFDRDGGTAPLERGRIVVPIFLEPTIADRSNEAAAASGG